MMLTIIDRIASLSVSTPTIDKRWILLVYRVCTIFPEFVQYTIQTPKVTSKLQQLISTEWDTLVKILVLCATYEEVRTAIKLDLVIARIQAVAQGYLAGTETEEITSNSFLYVGNYANAHKEDLAQFQPLITSMLYIAKDKTGPVRKNAAIAVARLSQN